jgi:hypothetical protein
MSLKYKTNAYRVKQKVFSRGCHHRPEDRVNMPPRKKYYYQADKNRLFVCYHAEQSKELKNLCGKAVKHLSHTIVAFRRLHDPFMEEIHLSK